ncbi:hypothetical protein SHO565_01000 [Streptomyces sp. HO565]
MSIPPSGAARAALSADAPSTATSAAHAGPPAGRTNHPEMSFLPVRMRGTLGAAAPPEAHQRASRPV